jgi:hypothetical protein
LLSSLYRPVVIRDHNVTVTFMFYGIHVHPTAVPIRKTLSVTKLLSSQAAAL